MSGRNPDIYPTLAAGNGSKDRDRIDPFTHR
jgi:hypothetical protein